MSNSKCAICINCVKDANLKGASTCTKESKMTFNQFEDYFIDRVVKCPYFVERKEESNGD